MILQVIYILLIKHIYSVISNVLIQLYGVDNHQEESGWRATTAVSHIPTRVGYRS
jgi:hypothetical protein